MSWSDLMQCCRAQEHATLAAEFAATCAVVPS